MSFYNPYAFNGKPPIDISSQENPSVVACLGTTIGRRFSNEDTHDIHLSMLHHPQVAFFGIFDGHGGKQASEYVKRHLANRISSLKDIHDHEAIRKAFVETDEQFINFDKSTDAGTCAVIALVDMNDQKEPFSVTVCNLGDSRALLIPHPKEGRRENEPPFIGLTNDHKPDSPEEKSRIEAAGGFVSAMGGVARINGSLAVSRAFGDRFFKNSKGSANEKLVIVIPEIKEVKAMKGDYLLLACDGLFEPVACTSEWVSNFVSTRLRSSRDMKTVVKDLINEVLKAGSGDNITVMLIKFKKENEPEEVEEKADKAVKARDEEDTASTNSGSDSEEEKDDFKAKDNNKLKYGHRKSEDEQSLKRKREELSKYLSPAMFSSPVKSFVDSNNSNAYNLQSPSKKPKQQPSPEKTISKLNTEYEQKQKATSTSIALINAESEKKANMRHKKTASPPPSPSSSPSPETQAELEKKNQSRSKTKESPSCKETNKDGTSSSSVDSQPTIKTESDPERLTSPSKNNTKKKAKTKTKPKTKLVEQHKDISSSSSSSSVETTSMTESKVKH